ncbi:LLM class flavin-dependent oxidoreductase [Marinicrinis lubricantis]|uniref:LLM class flavin-dependent oxidoreductase n=1 Tax=Marinicrinis lubricantis TaxID=2086470 RepID=A0ABW1INU3_9BACL
MNEIKLSVLDLSPVFKQADPQTALQQSVRLAKAAERLGYHRYWVSEHHDMEQLASASPEILLAHIGAFTKSIRLGSGAVLLPYYSPLKVAETFHMLSVLYPGRIDLGVGRAPGGTAHVSMALGGNFLERVHQMPIRVKDLSKLLTRQYTYEDHAVQARPIPPVAPELWLLGTNEKSAGYAAEQGAGYAFGQFMSDQDGERICRTYRASFQKSMLREQPQVMVAVQVVCAKTNREAKELAEQHRPDAPQSGNLPERSNSFRNTLIGTPLQLKEQLIEMKSKYQADEFMVVCMIPDYEKRMRSYELLAEACMAVI